MQDLQPGWQFWIDRGGTFTDIVARRPDGRLFARKLLSENVRRYPDAGLQGIRDLLADHPDWARHPVESVKMGTTVGTNALLERKGEPTLLAITRGFADLLRIGYQDRPDLFALRIDRPEPLYADVIEIGGRLDAAGADLEALDLAAAETDLLAAHARGFRALAIVLMHAWRNPAHERALEVLARRIGFDQVSLSHQCSPGIRVVPRGDTTVVNAYLSPILRHYVRQFEQGLIGALPPATRRPAPALRFMQSNGGLIEAGHFQGKDSILSGPAGGLIGSVAAARRAGFERIVTFDMGGTSTDVAHYAGELERVEETRVAGVRLRVPMLDIHTVAAGGGSILHYDGLSFRAGPDSAGAEPGPACYRRGGPLCVTDANVMLGKLQADFFPNIFGPGGDQPLDVEAVRTGFAALAAEVERGGGSRLSPEQVAEGFVRVAVEQMAAAIQKISIERGHDLTRDYTLCCFGAAGGQHACLVAERLGLRRILLHPLAGVLSAYGMGLADHRLLREQAVMKPLDAGLMPELRRLRDELVSSARDSFASQGLPAESAEVQSRIALRLAGTDTALELDFGTLADMRRDFEALHRQRFGFTAAGESLLAERIIIELVLAGETPTATPPAESVPGSAAPAPLRHVRLFSGGCFHEAPVYQRPDLPPGTRLTGPAMLLEPTSTTLIEPGWSGSLSASGDLILNRDDTPGVIASAATERDPIRLEIFNRLFMSVAEDMGYTLQKTAHSVNIKERLDFSCALFDGMGELVANAPHIPVHLGSMGESVKALIRSHRAAFRPGDVWLTNSPYHGGTHLPDITVITPLLDTGSGEVLFYLASRGHHADVGGITPGSMPPASTRIDQEGALSDGLRIVRDGAFQAEAIRAWLSAGPFPARNPEQNLADLRAQIAANARGAAGLQRLVEQYSLATVQAYMRHVQDHAEEAIRRAIAQLREGEFTVPMDSGAQILVRIGIDRIARSAALDFTGTSPQQEDNGNAPAAICQAAALYVFRTLSRDDIPLNAGCLRPLSVQIPSGCLLNPQPPAAVVAGNVETSQHIVDALYGALGLMAAAQGTMNNFTFGNDRYQYYETICGGTGAGADFAGADAIHSHMTNSRITDPEILEWRFPVRVETFAIRRGSGGDGHCRGGDGVIRRLRFLEDMTVGVLSSRRRTAPFGLEGGLPGLPGRNRWLKAGSGEVIELEGRVEVGVAPGDGIEIATPGGGGYGEPGSGC
jgi:5-oxoprolinase (ATP-hydrolysing)